MAEAKAGNGAVCELTQQTKYPLDGQVRIQVAHHSQRNSPWYLRIPAWLKGMRSSVLNGRPPASAVQNWELCLPSRPHL